MTPDKVKRAAQLLKAYPGLQEILETPAYDPPEDGQGQLVLCEEVGESGCSIAASAYLPDDLLRQLAKIAISLIKQELVEMGVELPDKPDG